MVRSADKHPAKHPADLGVCQIGEQVMFEPNFCSAQTVSPSLLRSSGLPSDWVKPNGISNNLIPYSVIVLSLLSMCTKLVFLLFFFANNRLKNRENYIFILGMLKQCFLTPVLKYPQQVIFTGFLSDETAVLIKKAVKLIK